MIFFSNEFVKTAYPGYLWNVIEQKLYTIKTTGKLRPLTYQKGGYRLRSGRVTVPGYQISVDGVRKTITLNYLRSLNKKIFISETY